MHKPTLGGYPLTLRNNDVSNGKNGELLMDYEENDLYYIDKTSGEKIRVADSIYKKLIEARLENSKIKIGRANSDVECEEELTPEIDKRKQNTFYMNITRAAVVSST